MNRILKINIKDIIYDYRQASSIVNKACNRQTPMVVQGCFISGDNIILFLEQAVGFERDSSVDYIFSPFEGITEEDIIGEVTSRYYADFTTLICFEIENKFWGLFAKRLRIDNMK